MTDRCRAPAPTGADLDSAAHRQRQNYCTRSRYRHGDHQLRHGHTAGLINSGVSIEVVCPCLGHAFTETTLIYILPADKVSDHESVPSGATPPAADRSAIPSSGKRSFSEHPPTRFARGGLLSVGRETIVC